MVCVAPAASSCAPSATIVTAAGATEYIAGEEEVITEEPSPKSSPVEREREVRSINACSSPRERIEFCLNYVKAKILGEGFISSFICAFLFLLLRAKEKETHPKKKKKRYFPTPFGRSI